MDSMTDPNELAAEIQGLSLSAKPLKMPKNRHRNENQAKTTTTIRKTNKPRLDIMQRPTPTHEYLTQAAVPPSAIEAFRPLLVILDLNGTLLVRRYAGGSQFIPRPGLFAFLDYLFTYHQVMVWSSARRFNVENMCAQVFTPAQLTQLVRIWSREDLHLSREAFLAHCQVYKQLRWVWTDSYMRRTHPRDPEEWSQADTVLIDDSTLKAVAEPHNLLEVPEFVNAPWQRGEEVLREVRRYLNVLSTQRDVSAYIRECPFHYEEEMGEYRAGGFSPGSTGARFLSSS